MPDKETTERARVGYLWHLIASNFATVMESYDAIVIGSGPGGYVAAIRSAQLGNKTAIIEKYSTLGGTCLNVGCIPSKALLDSSEHYHRAKEQFSAHGIGVGTLSLDFPQMVSRKNEVVGDTTAGIDFLFKKNKIDWIKGWASIAAAGQVKVNDKIYNAKHIIIATGSEPSTLSGIEIDETTVVTSTGALALDRIPEKMIVIGAGVIGLELGSVYARLGSEVEIIEFLDEITPGMDAEVQKTFQRILKKQGLKFHLKTEVKEVKAAGRSVTVKADNKKGEELTFKAEHCLVSVGRKPFTDGLNLEAVGIYTDERGMIPVDGNLRTSQPHIYAIGDVIKGAMLAHKAEEEGVMVAEMIAGEKPHIDYNLIPGVVYTWPEVASVGRSEEQLKADKVNYKVGSFPFKASGRARASMDTDGQVKVLAHAETDEILGIHMIGPRAADMIAEAVVAMEFRASAEDISRMSHAHPTFTEALKEAALAATGDRALHI